MRRKRNYTEFGLYVITKLNELNMTHKELCHGIGIPYASLSEILTGKQRNADRIAMIRKYLDEAIEQEGGEKSAI